MPSPRLLRRAVVVFVPVIAFIGLLAYGLTTSAPNKVGPGSTLPNFELTRLDRDGVLTANDLRGSPVVINFWASWCIPCREEAEDLQATYEEYRDEGVVFVGVNIKDSTVGAKEFIDEFGVTYPMVSDPDEDLARDLGVVGIPETFFIDSEGVFVGSASGRPLDKEQGVQRLGPVSREVLTTNIDILLRRS